MKDVEKMRETKPLTAWVPRDTAEQVAQRVKKRGFISVSDYLRTLIRQDLEEEMRK